MPVRDVLWACPVCLTTGGIRPGPGRGESCRSCGTRFRRGRGATIVAGQGGTAEVRTVRAWLERLGPATLPVPGPDGVILGPEPVRVKRSARQRPLRFGPGVLGWVEIYDRPEQGTIALTREGLTFRREGAAPSLWSLEGLKGVQPASSSLQLRYADQLLSLKFPEGSVRLWTRTLGEALREHHRRAGRAVVELQPCVRTCPLSKTS